MGELALAKVEVDRLADEAVGRCRAACGAAGFFSENRLVEYQALTSAFHSAGGDNQLILLDAAWRLVTGDRYVPPGAGPQGPVEEGAEPDWPLLLAARERALYGQLAAALRDTAEAGEDLAAAWQDRSDTAQAFAQAHRARVTLETLAAHRQGAGRAEDPAVPAGLYRLLGLEEVLPHADWYAAAGLLTPAAAARLGRDLTETCRRLVPHTASLVRLLEVPPGVPAGPLGGDEYVRDLTT